MAITRRQGVVFAAGLALGAVVTAMLVMGLRATRVADAPRAGAQPKVQTAAPAKPRTGAAAQPVAVATRFRTECPLQALLPPAGGGDGQVRLQDAATRTAADVASFITAGKEAAAAGKRRDAEVSFVMACRIADRLGGADSAAPADARYQLGRHYANVALSADYARRSSRNELLRRAELLYVDSHEAFVAKHGPSHEKARFAADGLASVRQTLAQAGLPPQQVAAPQKPAPAAVAQSSPATRPEAAAPKAPAPEPRAPVVAARPPPAVAAPAPAPVNEAPAPVTAARPTAPAPAAATPAAPAPAPAPATATAERTAPLPPAVAGRPLPPQAPVAAAPPTPVPARPARPARTPEPRETEVAVAEPQVRQATGSATQVRPSFDCGKARSPSEKAICADAELSQLDRDLGRLHARARVAAADSAAFRRQNEQEWRRRESTCRGDRECLRQWYASRRDQLLNDID